MIIFITAIGVFCGGENTEGIYPFNHYHAMDAKWKAFAGRDYHFNYF